MRRLLILLLLPTLSLLGSTTLKAQNKGQLGAGFETNTTYYFKDSLTGTQLPDNRFGTNNYLKMDYTYGSYAAGLQYEAYMPALVGYPSQLNGHSLAFKYASYTQYGFQFTLGNFYEQFGSGLLFRAWEDRALGLNTSLEGIRLSYTFKNFFTIKALYGRPRYYLDYATS